MSDRTKTSLEKYLTCFGVSKPAQEQSNQNAKNWAGILDQCGMKRGGVGSQKFWYDLGDKRPIPMVDHRFALQTKTPHPGALKFVLSFAPYGEVYGVNTDKPTVISWLDFAWRVRGLPLAWLEYPARTNWYFAGSTSTIFVGWHAILERVKKEADRQLSEDGSLVYSSLFSQHTRSWSWDR